MTEANYGDVVPRRSLTTWLKLLRPRQWTKNLIVFAAPLFAGKLHHWQEMVNASLCFLAFAAMSSAIYALNDIVDRAADRLHPVKCKRPIASGAVSVMEASILALVCVAVSLTIAFSIKRSLGVVVIAYMLLMVAYSFKLKAIAVIDAFVIAGGFVLRAVAGAVAAYVPASAWFLLCTSFLALFLGFEKRRQELKVLDENAHGHRKALADYSPDLINRLEALILPSLMTCYALYCINSFHGEWMLLTMPIALYGLIRYQQLSVRSSVTGTPEEVLLKDRPIQICLVLWVLTSAAVVYGLPTQVLNYVLNIDK